MFRPYGNLFLCNVAGLANVFFLYRSGLVMQRFAILFLTSGLVLAAEPALAVHAPNFAPHFATEHDTATRLQDDKPASPYAMSYTDEVAQSLGVRNGKADFFDSGRSDDAFVPALKMGVDGGSAMIRLQWHPGE
jgi:hypothetical protein